MPKFGPIFRVAPALLIGSALLAVTADAKDALASLPALERVTVMAAPKVIADFELLDQHGKPRKLATLRGAPVLIFFGFTRCPAICPAALTKLKLMQGSSMQGSNDGALKAAQVVFISVDGERDSPAVIKKYLAALSPEFIGLTGNPRDVANIAARFSAVAFKEQADSKGNYDYFHSSQIFLLDRDGRLRASFSDASLENMTAVTRLVLNESL